MLRTSCSQPRQMLLRLFKSVSICVICGYLNILELQEKIEVCVGGFEVDPVMSRTGGDQNIGDGRGFAGFAAPPRQFARFLPHLVIDGKFWQLLLVSAQGRAFFFVSRPGPKFEANRCAPRCLTGLQEKLDPCPDHGVASGAELFDPG